MSEVKKVSGANRTRGEEMKTEKILFKNERMIVLGSKERKKLLKTKKMVGTVIVASTFINYFGNAIVLADELGSEISSQTEQGSNQVNTEVPGETPAPVTPEAPKETPAPVTPEIPKETPAPVTPEAPKETPAPVTPEAPKETPAPVTPEVPKETPVPVTPEAPKETPAPVTPEAPKETPAPVTPEAPKEMPVPVTPEAPGETIPPVSSSATTGTPELNDRLSSETTSNPIDFEKSETTESFIEKIGEDAREIAKENDLYASVMIAQAILESGSGTSQLSRTPYYNLFGIKSDSPDHSVVFETQEDNGHGELSTIQASFKVYDSYKESLVDYVKLLKEGLTYDPEFYSGAWRSNAETYQDATLFLTGRYATDISYNEKLNALIEMYELEKYDSEATDAIDTAGDYMKPLEEYVVTSNFGIRGNEFHRGIDLAAPAGSPIVASQSGKIVTAEYHPSWGNYVVIAHEDGNFTLYAHQSLFIVKAGQEVARGSVIGYVGSTGNSTGPHLHFEFSTSVNMTQSDLVDPLKIFNQ